MSNLLKDMKLLNEDHTPEGFPAVKMSEINGLIEIIEKQSIQLAKANERVRELEQAIMSNCYDDPSASGKRLMALASEQLRKEQSNADI